MRPRTIQKPARFPGPAFEVLLADERLFLCFVFLRLVLHAFHVLHAALFHVRLHHFAAFHAAAIHLFLFGLLLRGLFLFGFFLCKQNTGGKNGSEEKYE
jgi:hypothetical protein